MTSHATLRVAIIGAGLSGLTAADVLLSTHANPFITVFECAPRVGGRTHSTPLACAAEVEVDLGGQWVGAQQSAVLALVSRFGLALHSQFARGKRALVLHGVTSVYTGLIPSVSLAALVDAQAAILALNAYMLVARLGGGATFDAVSMEQFIQRRMWTAQGRALVRIIVQALFGREPADTSMLAFLRYVSANGGSIERMSEMGEGSTQSWTIVGGSQQLSLRLAEEIRSRGGVIALNERVVAVRVRPAYIDGSGDGQPPIEVETAAGARERFDHVIMALPPPMAGRIAYDPPLPAPRHSLFGSATMGCIIKVIVVYAAPFWRTAGWSGEVIVDVESDPLGGPAFNIFDACQPRPSLRVSSTTRTTLSNEGGSRPVSGTDGSFSSAAISSSGDVNSSVCPVPVLTSEGTPGSSSGWWVPPSAAVANAPLLCVPPVDVASRACPVPVPLRAALPPSSVVSPAPSPTEAPARGGANAPPSAATPLPPLLPALVLFINGAAATRWSGAEKAGVRRTALLAQLARLFGPEALSPMEVVEKDWVADPHTGGCPIGSYGSGVLTGFGVTRGLAEPCWPTAPRGRQQEGNLSSDSVNGGKGMSRGVDLPPSATPQPTLWQRLFSPSSTASAAASASARAEGVGGASSISTTSTASAVTSAPTVAIDSLSLALGGVGGEAAGSPAEGSPYIRVEPPTPLAMPRPLPPAPAAPTTVHTSEDATTNKSISSGGAACFRLYWAGTETAAVGTGFMDGAIRAGQRAAAEVLAARS